MLNRKPVAYLVCNQSPPGADGTPSLMTFRDVETLFHEVSKALFKKLKTISNLSPRPRFCFVITVLTEIKPDKRLQKTAKFVGKMMKSIFNRHCPWCRLRAYLNSLLALPGQGEGTSVLSLLASNCNKQ